jgi:formylglycine-generating enzyme required for sulfatase activity
MLDRFLAEVTPPSQIPPPNMMWIPGGTFRMGSDDHYREEAPAHRVTVGGFWIDRTPVTNRQFKQFSKSTGHKTFAEAAPDPKNYPGALPHMIFAGSLVFASPDHPVDLNNWGEWWKFLKGADWRHPYGPKSNTNHLENHPVVHVACADALAYAEWAVRICRPKPSGNTRRVVDSMERSLLGAMSSHPAGITKPTRGKATFHTKTTATTASTALLRSWRFRPTATASTT